MMLERHFLLSDTEFLTKFEAATLDLALFSHEAHLRLAWLYIKIYGIEKAVDKTCAQLQHFTKVLGAEDKFNTTLTVAAVKGCASF